jgi:hypothetical protein
MIMQMLVNFCSNLVGLLIYRDQTMCYSEICAYMGATAYSTYCRRLCPGTVMAVPILTRIRSFSFMSTIAVSYSVPRIQILAVASYAFVKMTERDPV